MGKVNDATGCIPYNTRRTTEACPPASDYTGGYDPYREKLRGQ